MQDETTPEQTPPALPAQKIIIGSKPGDIIHRMALPVLDWMLTNGDQDMMIKAGLAKADWTNHQGFFIKWGNTTRFFELAEMAIKDLSGFKEAMQIIPDDDPGVLRIVGLALMVGESWNKPTGIKPVNFLERRRLRRGRRR